MSADTEDPFYKISYPDNEFIKLYFSSDLSDYKHSCNSEREYEEYIIGQLLPLLYDYKLEDDRYCLLDMVLTIFMVGKTYYLGDRYNIYNISDLIAEYIKRGGYE